MTVKIAFLNHRMKDSGRFKVKCYGVSLCDFDGRHNIGQIGLITV